MTEVERLERVYRLAVDARDAVDRRVQGYERAGDVHCGEYHALVGRRNRYEAEAYSAWLWLERLEQQEDKG